jgi:hypothetical protein
MKCEHCGDELIMCVFCPLPFCESCTRAHGTDSHTPVKKITLRSRAHLVKHNEVILKQIKERLGLE